jgi:transcriptional regulator with XRE-family HTH domain
VLTQRYFDALAAKVAAIFRAERIRRGLSMNAVAERGGLSQQMVSYVEREMRNPSLDTMLRMAAALEIDLGNVLRRAQRSTARLKAK